MDFLETQPIYLQIADTLCEHILRKEWKEEDRIPSVRDLAVQFEVNPNTVQRTYSWLQEKDIIRNKRGIGYFVAKGAFKRTLNMKKVDFVDKTCPRIFQTLKLLNIRFQDLKSIYEEWKLSDKA